MNADGSNQRLLFAEGDLDEERPSFTPDGSAIVFSRCQLDGETCTLYQIKTDGSGLTPATEFDFGTQDLSAVYSPGVIRLTDAGHVNTLPVFSPDGTKILYMSDRLSPGSFDIFEMDADGSHKKRIIPGGLVPNWGPQTEHER